MAEITKYILVNRDDEEGDHEYDTMQEAVEAATDGEAVVAYRYVFEDSELVWTPDGSDTWPPSAPEDERERLGQRNYT